MFQWLSAVLVLDIVVLKPNGQVDIMTVLRRPGLLSTCLCLSLTAETKIETHPGLKIQQKHVIVIKISNNQGQKDEKQKSGWCED